MIEGLAWLTNNEERVFKVAELTAHLERRGYRNMVPGYISNALAGLAERGLASRHSYGRWRIHETHPELVTLRLSGVQCSIGEGRQWVREIDEAERRGRQQAFKGQ